MAGESENYGTEQEHLNNVFGAHLHITAIRAAAGPGIEFLDYLAPRDGRPTPVDEHANDLMHWQTKLTTTDAEAAWRDAVSGKFVAVSSGAISMPDSALGFQKGLLVRDPDGHVMELIQK